MTKQYNKKPRIILMADYLGGYEIAKYLCSNKENIVGLVVRSQKQYKYLNDQYKKKILKLIKIDIRNIFDWDLLKKPKI